MMPIGPLMIEHRLIERMLEVVKEKLRVMQEAGKADASFVKTVVSFIRSYADQCHHGKEEDILFRELAKKDLSLEHKAIMQELIEEHRWGRETTGRLLEANELYEAGDASAIEAIVDGLDSLVRFYPAHIEKEDRNFFIPVMGYLTSEEKDAMLAEGYRFDSDLLHQEYADLVRALEGGKEHEGKAGFRQGKGK
ncbi:MAG: hemerythrin domain-containing protein [Deltaproteobacteria bacterium]|nr:hemerythrin domain-containing protein [Deltaproteobacteria bacterium]